MRSTTTTRPACSRRRSARRATCTRSSRRSTRGACSRASTSPTARCRGSSRSTRRRATIAVSNTPVAVGDATLDGAHERSVQADQAAAELSDRVRRRAVRRRRRRQDQERRAGAHHRAARARRGCRVGRADDAAHPRSRSRSGSASRIRTRRPTCSSIPTHGRVRRDGEPGPRHLHRDVHADRCSAPVVAAQAALRSSAPRTSSRTSGSATSSRRRGGTTSGSTRASRAGWRARSPAKFEPAWHYELEALARARLGARGGQHRHRAPGAPADRERRRHPDRVRRHHVRQGRQRPRTCSRRTSAPRRSRRACASTSKANAYGNATSADFVAAMSAAAGKDLGPGVLVVPRSAGRAGDHRDDRLQGRPEGRARAAAVRAAGLAAAAGRQAVGRAGVRRLRQGRQARRGVHAARRAHRLDRARVVPALGDAERRRARLLRREAHGGAGHRAARRGVAAAVVDRAPRSSTRR